ncbi:MAG: Uma2 family endonuclease [Saprospiraceae bacterium]|nr:Uma2 family endonuclease [Saprospiraceae bacterium]
MKKTQQYYTKEEYFDLLEASEVKIEYRDGYIEAMAGAPSNHNILSGNFRAELHFKLRETDCVVYDSDQAVRIEKYNCYVFPDASVVCGKREFEDEKKLRLKNPFLIIEVLSENTEAYDRGEKFSFYRSLPSFKEYVLIHSNKVWVESFYREESNLWRISTVSNLHENIHLYSLNLDISVQQLYSKTEDIF